MGERTGKIRCVPLTVSLPNRWKVQVQVQPEAQVRWVLGMPKRLALCKEDRPGCSALSSPGLGFMQIIPRRLWSLALYKPTVENQPRNCLGKLRILSLKGKNKGDLFVCYHFSIFPVTVQGMGHLSSHQVRHSG